MEAENRRIMEFVARQQHMEEDRMAKIREREEAKDHLLKMVETTFFSITSSLFSDTCCFETSLFPLVLPQLSKKIEQERQQREEMERVREELCLEEQEEENRRRDIVRISTLLF